MKQKRLTFVLPFYFRKNIIIILHFHSTIKVTFELQKTLKKEIES